MHIEIEHWSELETMMNLWPQVFNQEVMDTYIEEFQNFYPTDYQLERVDFNEYLLITDSIPNLPEVGIPVSHEGFLIKSDT